LRAGDRPNNDRQEKDDDGWTNVVAQRMIRGVHG
jgi:hypothetical protein